MLMRGEADLTSAPISLTKERREVIDFTIPVGNEVKTFSQMSHRGMHIDFWAYTDMFTGTLWTVLFVLMVSTSVALLATQTYFEKTREENPFLVLFKGFAFFMSVLIQRDYPLSKRSLPNKIIFATTCISTYLERDSSQLTDRSKDTNTNQTFLRNWYSL
jgi:hypothetical protein